MDAVEQNHQLMREGHVVQRVKSMLLYSIEVVNCLLVQQNIAHPN